MYAPWEGLKNNLDSKLRGFINARTHNSTQLNVPPMTTRQFEENIKRIGGNKATGRNGFGFKS